MRGKILTNAPKGATHYDNGVYHRMEGNYFMWFDSSFGVWEEDPEPITTRPLDDIKRIVELEER